MPLSSTFAAGRLVARARIGRKLENASAFSQATGLATYRAQDCQSVRIYVSEQCPRQDSNLRSRLRRPVPFTAATWQNAHWRPRWGAYGERRIAHASSCRDPAWPERCCELPTFLLANACQPLLARRRLRVPRASRLATLWGDDSGI